MNFPKMDFNILLTVTVHITGIYLLLYFIITAMAEILEEIRIGAKYNPLKLGNMSLVELVWGSKSKFSKY